MSEYLCKDCKHGFMSFDNKIFTLNGRVGANKFMYKCRKSFQNTTIQTNPVTGYDTVKPSYESCVLSRNAGKPCGPNAKMWEPKYKRDLFKLIAKDNVNE